MATVSTVISNLQTVVGGIAGIRKAPTEPPENMNAFPFAVAYVGSGNLGGSAHGRRLRIGTHELVVEIHLQRIDLPRAVAAAMPYLELFQTAIAADPTLSGTVSAITEINYEFGALPSYGGVETLGFEFRFSVQIAG